MKKKHQIHFLTILFTGCSATIWTVSSTKYLISFLWVIFLALWIIISNPNEFKMFFRRFSQIGLLLLIISLLQIIFRREGSILLSFNGFPIVFSVGLREAILLWIRYMIIFMLAYIFAQVPLFNFLVFLNKIGISLQLSFLLLTTLKFIPFIFDEAKKGLWAIRFRGIQLSNLSIKGKYIVLKKLFKPILFRGINFVSFSSLALELRGYNTKYQVKIKQPYPLRVKDYLILVLVFIINLGGVIY